MDIKIILLVSLVGLSGCATSKQSVVKEDIPNEQVAIPSEVFDLAELDQIPKPIGQLLPVHPYKLYRAFISGEATIEFIVTEEGYVVNAEAIESSHPDFAVAAITAVQRWIFKPGMKEGVPVACRMQMPISFEAMK